VTGGPPAPRPSRAATPPPTPVVSGDPITPAASPRRAIALLVAGIVVFAFGMVTRAPMSPSAVMSGVVDSVQVLPSAAAGLFGRRIPTKAAVVYLPKAPTARVFRLPPAAASLAESLRAGDTLQALLGWRSEADTATALRIVRNGAMILDSTVVLSAQRQERSRIGLAGAVLMLLGVVLLIRRAPPTTA
jgi:hypothetical protein